MQVKFTDKAIAHLESIIDIYIEYAGERYAMKFSSLVDQKLKRLMLFPASGFPEPLLEGRKYLYRATIIHNNYKMIYYVEGSTIWVSAFWDMRMSPSRLQKMI
ncbi:MAG: type II toxin-antitoxin system RelE/ParE family toxin [Prevotella sp.]|nr:type II toxin-antitoxin system RelE/ParE family toxin [Prevotella sp.]